MKISDARILGKDLLEDNKKYSTNNITGIYGCDLMVDNEKYIIKVIRKRNEADGDGVEDTEGVHENEGEVSLDSNVTDKNQIILYLS